MRNRIRNKVVEPACSLPVRQTGADRKQGNGDAAIISLSHRSCLFGRQGFSPSRALLLLFLTLLLFCSQPAYAFDYLKFALGIGSGYVIHEAAHQAVADINGTPFKWKAGSGGTWVSSSNTTDSERYELASAGLGSQVLSSEIILNSKSIPKDNEYVIGMLTFNVVNALIYVVSDGIMYPNDNHGDIEVMDKAGLDRDYVNTFLIVHSLYTIYRAYYKTDIPVYMTMSKNEIKVGVTILRW